MFAASLPEPSDQRFKALGTAVEHVMSLSETLCLRHSMTIRSIYAKQDEAGGSRHDGVAVDPQVTH